jgi:hypothetical protein
LGKSIQHWQMNTDVNREHCIAAGGEVVSKTAQAMHEG